MNDLLKDNLLDLRLNLEKQTLAMEQTADPGALHLLFRTVHNLKGSLDRETHPALHGRLHQLEDRLDAIRRGRQVWQPDVADAAMGIVDELGDLLDPSRARPSALEVPPVEETWGMGNLKPEVQERIQAALDGGLGLYRLDKLIRQKGLNEVRFLGLPVFDDLRDLGMLLAVRPDWTTFEAGPEEQILQCLFASARPLDDLTTLLWDPLIQLRAPAATSIRACRFLIIEDDPTAGGLLHYLLNKEGEATLCENAREGLQAFRKALDQGQAFDMVVLDLFLPDVHGNGVLREIRAMESERGIRDVDQRCFVLINTASQDPGQIRESLELEPDGYLVKPLQVPFLLAKVAQVRTRLALED